MSIGDKDENFLQSAQRLQDGLVSVATGHGFTDGDDVYMRLRRAMFERIELRELVPEFVRRSRDPGQFWQFIKQKFSTYAERREFIWASFHPLLDHLESIDRSPGVQPISEALEKFDPDKVHAAWQKALARRTNDPEGAITAARTLLESVCKHVLDDSSVEYADDADLPKLWATAADALNLAPHQHQEKLFKAILGNAQSIVGSLGALRNKIGDAHGTGRRAVKPLPRHAELAVNLAGTMAAFLVATLKERAGN
jgi:hypothetical protein